MKNLIILINLLIFTSCRTRLVTDSHLNQSVETVNALTDSVTNLRNVIADFNEVQDSHIGYGGSPSEQYANYEALLEIATDKELVLLSKDTNYVVATYATFGLIERDNPYFFDVFRRFLTENQSVKVKYGCSEGEDLASNQVYFNYFNKVKFSTEDEIGNLQKDLTLLKMDSLILANENISWIFKKHMFEYRIYDESYLPLIEKQAFEKENIYAIEYLFKNNVNEYTFQIIEVLKNYLKNEHVGLSHYNLIYEMLLSFKYDELNLLLRDELIDIQKEHGDEEMDYFKIILNEKE